MSSRLRDWHLSVGVGEILRELSMAERLRNSELRLQGKMAGRPLTGGTRAGAAPVWASLSPTPPLLPFVRCSCGHVGSHMAWPHRWKLRPRQRRRAGTQPPTCPPGQ